MSYSTSLGSLTTKIIFVILLSTILIQAQTEQDSTASVQTSDTTFVMTKSPWGAVLRSAVLPGWGQYYNESYWKIPIVWGIMGYFASIWIDQHNLYWDSKKLYAESGYTSSKALADRNFYRNQRDEFAVYIGLVYFLTLVDAYVDAHLFDFDVSVDLYTRQPQFTIKLPLY